MKFIKALFVGMVMVVSADASPNFLEPHQTTMIKVPVQVGKSAISVIASGEKSATPLSCTFYDSSGNRAGKPQERVISCDANVNMVAFDQITIKITNEADEKVQYAVSVASIKK